MELNQDEIRRFLDKINKVQSGCWEWGAGVYVTGYGMFCMRRGNRKTFSAHRISWMLHNNASILNGVMVCHTCDNRLCVNPDHLYLGTGYDNNNDTIIRNRGNRTLGSKCSWAKLDEDKVREIRRLKSQGLKQSKIALMYNIDASLISDIIHNKKWRHVS